MLENMHKKNLVIAQLQITCIIHDFQWIARSHAKSQKHIFYAIWTVGATYVQYTHNNGSRGIIWHWQHLLQYGRYMHVNLSDNSMRKKPTKHNGYNIRMFEQTVTLIVYRSNRTYTNRHRQIQLYMCSSVQLTVIDEQLTNGPILTWMNWATWKNRW